MTKDTGNQLSASSKMTSSFFSSSVSSVSVGLSTFPNSLSGLSHISSTLFRASWHSRPSFTQEMSDGLEFLDCPVTRSTQASHESLLLPNWNATSPKFNLLWALIRVWALIPTNYFRLGSNSRMGLNSSRGPNSSKYGNFL